MQQTGQWCVTVQQNDIMVSSRSAAYRRPYVPCEPSCQPYVNVPCSCQNWSTCNQHDMPTIEVAIGLTFAAGSLISVLAVVPCAASFISLEESCPLFHCQRHCSITRCSTCKRKGSSYAEMCLSWSFNCHPRLWFAGLGENSC